VVHNATGNLDNIQNLKLAGQLPSLSKQHRTHGIYMHEHISICLSIDDYQDCFNYTCEMFLLLEVILIFIAS
jgi:hypothetical protein